MKTTKKELLKNVQNYKSAKLVDNNTVKIEYNNGIVAYKLYNTEVVKIENNIFTLNSGGWRTPTTKDRINNFAPVKLYQKNNVWYFANGELFYDGCQIDATGKLISKVKNINYKKLSSLKAKIKKYCDLITVDNLPVPSSRDCWHCLLFKTDDNEHLYNHIKENYLHGSILVNSMREAGFTDNNIAVHYQLKLVDTFKHNLRKYLQKRLLRDII